MNIDEWKSQLRRGTLEYCILSLISKRDCYGYEIISEIGKFPIISIKESTIYPLLRRLQHDGYLTSFWQETSEGLPPRKYYSITANGKEYLLLMSHEWENLTMAISYMKGE
ncbi:MAG: PadR family transcriptional regulator [Anaerocolumna sp.]